MRKWIKIEILHIGGIFFAIYISSWANKYNESTRSEEAMIELTPTNLIMMAGAVLLIAVIFVFMVRRELK
jgi:hypothetical protein